MFTLMIIIIVIGFISLFTLAIVKGGSINKTKDELNRDDIEQLEYLKKYNKEK